MANKVNVEISCSVEGYLQGLNKATQSAEKYETEQRKISDATGNFKKDLGQAKREVLNLAQAYSKLDSAAKNSQFGKEMKRQLDEAKKKAAELIDMNADLSQELKNMASDTATFDSLSQGVNVFMNTTSAALGVVAQFTGNEEDAKRAVVAFTTAQSTLNAVTQIQNALQKQSALMLGIANIQKWAAAKATDAQTAATGRATIAQKAFNLVAKANPYVLLATAAIALTTAIITYSRASSKAAKAEEEQQKKIEETTKKIEDQRKSFIDASVSYAQTASRISALRTQYMTTNDELKKTAILQEAAKEFKNLGMEVKNLNDAQNILVNQGGKVIEMITAQGKAAALAALQAEAFKNSYRRLIENGYDVAGASALAGMNAEVLALGEEITKTNSKVSKLKKDLNIKDNIFSKGSSSKVKIDYEKDSLEDLRKQLSDIQNMLTKKNTVNIDVNKAKKEIERLQKEIETKEIELGFKEQDPKKIPFTEAWYKEEISKLEKQKALLPVDAYVERDQLQKQIDSMNGKLKLQIEGVVITSSAGIEKAVKGTYDKTIKGVSDAISALEEKMQGGGGGELIDADKFNEYAQKIAEMREELAKLQKTYDEAIMTPTEKAEKKMQDLSKTIKGVGDAVNAAGSMFSALGEAADDETMKAVGIVAQAVATVALSFAQALTTCKTWYEWLAFGLSGTATMISMISQIKSATSGYAEGGIVDGSSYSGDRVLARLNSGEMVLNQRQQRNMFNMLDTGAMPNSGGMNVTVTGVIRGTDLLLVQKNTNKVLSKAGSKINF